MKRKRMLLLLPLIALLCACVRAPAPLASPADEPRETLEARPNPAPTPTEDPEIRAETERRERFQAAAGIFSSRLGEEFSAHDFLSWLESEKHFSELSELIALPEDSDLGSFLHEKTGESLNVLRDGYSGILESAEAAKEHGIYFSPGAGEDTVIALAGDVNLVENGYVMPVYRAYGESLSTVLADGLLERLRAADVLLVNNEFAFTDRGAALPGKTYTFRSPPGNTAILNDMGVDVAFLANNHVYDYGEDGLYDTLCALREAGIPTIGAGMNLEEAARPVYYIVNGWKIAFVGAGCIERYGIFTPGATENSSGIFRTDEKNAEGLLNAIRDAAGSSDYVIANLHWGIESTTVLEDYQRELGRMCVDAGAHAVVGAHPLVLQGAELYNGSPIIYSTGNFWFSQTQNYTCLLELALSGGGDMSVKFVPCLTGGGITRLAAGDEAEKIIHYYEEISFGVEIDGEGYISGG